MAKADRDTDRQIFGIHESVPQTDRDGYDLPPLEYRGYLCFARDGSVCAYEVEDRGVEACGDEPQLEGRYEVVGDRVRFELTRLRTPEELELPDEEVYWWPPHSRPYFPAGKYTVAWFEGCLYLASCPDGVWCRILTEKHRDGDAILPITTQVPTLQTPE